MVRTGGHHCTLSGIEQQVNTVGVHDKEQLTDLVSWIQNQSREEKASAKTSRKMKASSPESLPPELIERSNDQINEAWRENDSFLQAFVRAFGPRCRSDEELENTFSDLLREIALPLCGLNGFDNVVQQSFDQSSTRGPMSRLLDCAALTCAAAKVFTVKDGYSLRLCTEIPVLAASGKELYGALEQLTRREEGWKDEFFTIFKSLIVTKRDDVCTELKSFITPDSLPPATSKQQERHKRKGSKHESAPTRKSARRVADVRGTHNENDIVDESELADHHPALHFTSKL
jgi:hypothetical protein